MHGLHLGSETCAQFACVRLPALVAPTHGPASPACVRVQGPLRHTRDAFWQMAVEQRCSAVIMLTNTGAPPLRRRHSLGAVRPWVLPPHQC